MGVAGAGTAATYNLVKLCDFIGGSREAKTAIAGIVLAAGAIASYKAVPFLRRVAKKARRNIQRTRNLREMSRDAEFLERQGVYRPKLGIVKSAVKYAVTVPAGGALGVLPGLFGGNLLCTYFGEFGWGDTSAWDVGIVAGALSGAYAFGEMAHKRQYRRMVTTGAVLAGGIGTFMLTNGIVDRLDGGYGNEQLINLGVDLAGGAAIGTGVNLLYRKIQDSRKKKKVMPRRELDYG